MKKTNFLTLIAAVVMLAMAACKPVDDPLANLTVTTADPTFITGRTASCGAEVTADDAGLLIEIGVCWSLTEKPTVENNVMKSHKCSQPYTCLLSNLEPNTVYHVRGYAKYGTEYCYGDEKTFTTLGADAPSASPVTTILRLPKSLHSISEQVPRWNPLAHPILWSAFALAFNPISPLRTASDMNMASRKKMAFTMSIVKA